MAESPGFITIIIPTYNRCEIIDSTVESCFRQDYPKDKYEIIVADNNSTDRTKEVVEQLKSRSPVPLKYLFEPRQGAHFARNTAAKESSGDFLYYTDDDMIADEKLLSKMIKVFETNKNVAVVGGRVLPKWEFDPPDWLLKYFKDGTLSLIDKPEKLIIADFDIGIYSCHQMIRKEVLFECGGFNPDIAKEVLIGNGETGLNIKILNKGYDFGYTSEAISYHAIPRSRMTQKYINSRFGNQANCDSFTTYRKNEHSKKALLRLVLYSHIPEAFKNYFRSIGKMISGNDSWRLNRAFSHYYFHRIFADLKLAINDDWREYALKFDYIDG